MDVAERIPALVLAGGKSTPEFVAAAGTPHRALADVNGWPMVRYVVEALREAECIDRILVIGPPEIPAIPGAERVLGTGSLIENIGAGLAACPDVPHALLVTADVPFLEGPAVDAHVRECLRSDTDLCYAAITQSACERAFPGQKRTYVTVSGTRATGGNVVLIRAPQFSTMAAAMQAAHERRKNPFFLTGMIGFDNAFRLITGSLKAEHIEAGAGRLLGVRCRLLFSEQACLGTDVDKPADLELARARLHPK